MARALWRVSAPMSLGILGTLSVGLADAAFLARAGAQDLTAVGFIYPVTVALTSLAIGMGAGTSAVVSQALGRAGDDDAMAARLALHSLIFATLLGLAVAGAFWLLAPVIYGWMGAEGAVLDKVLAYVPWWCASFPFMVAGMGLNAVFRAGGESHISATVMLAQSAINIAVTPVFIFGWAMIPALNTEGAAIGTFVARVLGFAGLAVFSLRSGRLALTAGCLDGLLASLRKIARIGGPAAASNAINPLGLSLVTSAAASLGDAQVAGFGAASRVQSLLFVPMLALSAGIGPVVGQAWGASKAGRAQDAVRLTFLTCLGYGALLALTLAFAAPWLARLMTDGGDAARYATLYLRWGALGFFGYGILVTANAAMNARDKALWSMGLSASRIALVYVPLAWAGALTLGFGGIVAAFVAANLWAVLWALVLTTRAGLLDVPLPGLRRLAPD
ncbi:putative efflux protein, MATE family [Tropicibacter naphthalenivorans]|uniref:Multidrug export protein MepA n=1 Tax=Tropicibacter naphthalenivorans TaxID=441103 RepID=A0A0P1G0D6_9RHOB|nr:Multidrug export protein MepA [Tropicibacter naphthalenivorans]SMC45748.1 putative efflux protein, MATE family [Tropicibacter naphthalenivorans]